MDAMGNAEPSARTISGDEAQAASTVVIDTNGDVFFELKEAVFRVSSGALSMASKVFNAMFNSEFQEGLNLAKNGTCRVPLLDDDADTMRVMCLLVHHQEPSSAFDKIHSKLVRDVAILIDKYTCTGAVSYWADAWIWRISYGLDFKDESVVDLLLAAYSLGLSMQFTAITKRMVYWTSTESKANNARGWFVEEKVHERLPQGLIATIKYRERTVKNELLEWFEELMAYLVEWEFSDLRPDGSGLAFFKHEMVADLGLRVETLHYCKNCQSSRYLYTLIQNGLWPMRKARQEMMLGVLIQKLQYLDLSVDECTTPRLNRALPICRECGEILRALAKDYAELASTWFSGLCLGCVKNFNSEGGELSAGCDEHCGFAT